MEHQSVFSALIISIAALLLGTRVGYADPRAVPKEAASRSAPITPKLFIISMYDSEGRAWYGVPDFNLLAHNVTVPDLLPLFPDVHRTANYDVCQLTTSEGQVNAASTMTALVYSPLFDLRTTYFFVAGVAGINPNQGTIADATFARYSVQVSLQYELDAREIPSNFSTGYFPQGAYDLTQYPAIIYGTEAFEVNDALRKIAVDTAKKAALKDSARAQAYRAKYAVGTAARSVPSVRECDVGTADTYFSGELLGDAFANYKKLVTNGTGIYCTAAQEDNGTLEPLLRAATTKLVDFARIAILHTINDFDQPYPRQSILQNLVYEDPGVGG